MYVLITTAATKGLGVVNMVRLGVLLGQGEGLLNSPRPNSAYFARPDRELRLWSDQVCKAFRDGPNAIYNLLLDIFRSEVVVHLQQCGALPSRALPVVPVASGSGGKRRTHGVSVSEVEDDDRPVRRRR